MPLQSPRLTMRIDLKVPYSEKDAAKILGARWDAAAKTWYVIDAVDLWPFVKWMPKHLTEPGKQIVVVKVEQKAKLSKAKQVKSKKAYERAMKRLAQKNTHFIAGPVTPRTDFSMFDPGCSCVPWEWCEHNPEPANPKTAFVYPTKPEYSFELAPEHLAHIRSILAE